MGINDCDKYIEVECMPQEQGEKETFLTMGSEKMKICSEFSDKWW